MSVPRDDATPPAGDVNLTVDAREQANVNVLGYGQMIIQQAPVAAAPPLPIDPPVCPLPVLRGRDGLVDEITAAAADRDGRPWVLHGLGGSGKSTVAMTVAARLRENHDVYWIDGLAIHQSMLTIAERRGVNAADVKRARTDWSEAHRLVWDSLNSGNRPWLLVFDNVDDPTALAGPDRDPAAQTGWLRSSTAGLVLVTCRYGDRRLWGETPVLRKVDVLDGDTGTAVLTDLAPGAGPAEDARALAERLGGLPLALWLAGRYLASEPLRHTTFATYRAALDRDLLDLIDRGQPWPGKADDERAARLSVRATWGLSLRMLEEKGLPAVRDVIRLLSCFGAPHPVRLELLDAARENGDLDGDAPLTEGALDQVVSNLAAVALVDRVRIDAPDEPVDCLKLPLLVAEVIAAGMGDERERTWAAALRSLAARTPEDAVDPKLWRDWATLPAVHQFVLTKAPAEFSEPLAVAIKCASVCALYLSTGFSLRSGHDLAQRATLRCNDLPVDDEARLHARLAAASVNVREGSLEPSVGELRALLDDARASQPPAGPLVSAITLNLADALFALGRQDEAAQLHDDLIVAHRDAGLEPPAAARLARAQLLAQRGEFADAESELTAVLDAARAEHGADDHPDVLTIRVMLADVLAARGQLTQAQDDLERVLRAQERLYGRESTATISTRYCLFGVLATQGDLAAAQSQLGRLLRIQRDSLNPEHPLSLLGLATLTTFQTDKEEGDPAQAEQQLRAICATLARQLGEQHPAVLMARFQAAIQRQAHDKPGAETECAEIVDAQTALHGPDHPLTLTTRLVHAQMVSDRDTVAGEVVLRRLHRVYQRTVGDDHPQAIQILQSLANLAYLHGDLTSTERLLRAVIESQIRVRGADHEDVQETLTVLVEVLVDHEKFDEAREELTTLIESVERTAGVESELAQGARLMRAAMHYRQGDLAEAERGLRQIQAILERLVEPDPYGLLIVRSLLGQLEREQGKYPEAELNLRAALQGLEAGWGVADEDALEARLELGELLHERRQLTEAQEHLRTVIEHVDEKHKDLGARAENALRVVTAELKELTPPPEATDIGTADAGDPAPAVEPAQTEPVAPEPARPPVSPTPPEDLAGAWRSVLSGDLAAARDAVDRLSGITDADRAALTQATDIAPTSAVETELIDIQDIAPVQPAAAPRRRPVVQPDPVPAGASEQELRSLLASRAAELGVDHPSTTQAWHAFAHALAHRGFPLAALAEFVALHGILGRRDEREEITLRVRLDIGRLRLERGDAARAGRDLDRLHDAAAAALGAEHRITLRARASLAIARDAVGVRGGAIRELRQVLSVDGRLADVRHDLAILLRDNGDPAGAEAECEQALVAGADALRVRAILAGIRGDHAQLADIVRSQVALHGQHHPDVAETRHLRAIALAAAGLPSLDEARLAHTARVRRLGADHPATRATAALLPG